jgi:nitrogen fixation protein NifZ
MIEPGALKFQWGQRVRAAADLFNDGSYPECAPDALLAGAGDVGEVVQTGTHVNSNLHIYLVEFGENRIVGCFEEEIAPL